MIDGFDVSKAASSVEQVRLQAEFDGVPDQVIHWSRRGDLVAILDLAIIELTDGAEGPRDREHHQQDRILEGLLRRVIEKGY
jgi:hypothetical protein